jgi:hypothetical protein
MEIMKIENRLALIISELQKIHNPWFYAILDVMYDEPSLDYLKGFIQAVSIDLKDERKKNQSLDEHFKKFFSDY